MNTRFHPRKARFSLDVVSLNWQRPWQYSSSLFYEEGLRTSKNAPEPVEPDLGGDFFHFRFFSPSCASAGVFPSCLTVCKYIFVDDRYRAKAAKLPAYLARGVVGGRGHRS